MSRIMVTGSRAWAQSEAPVVSRALVAAAQLRLAIERLDARNTSLDPSSVTLVHGAAKGLDSLAGEQAVRLGMRPEAHPAAWDQHVLPGSPDGALPCAEWCLKKDRCVLAGFRRNLLMMDSGIDLVLAFPKHPQLATGKGTSRGTWHCAKKAEEAGLPVLVVWNRRFYPMGKAGTRVLARFAGQGRFPYLVPGPLGELLIEDAIVPF